MTYSVTILRSAEKSLASLPPVIQDRLIVAIRRLAVSPRPPGVKKLAGREAWRIRVADYRVIYEIADVDLTILVVEIGHRREIYR
jgi:mRNA interferase RelE/StbE